MRVWERIRELKGFWIHEGWGGRFTAAERYSKERPDEEARFVSLDEIEERCGKVIAVRERAGDEDGDSYLDIWTERCVGYIADYDGWESLVLLPKEPPVDAERAEPIASGAAREALSRWERYEEYMRMKALAGTVNTSEPCTEVRVYAGRSPVMTRHNPCGELRTTQLEDHEMIASLLMGYGEVCVEYRHLITGEPIQAVLLRRDGKVTAASRRTCAELLEPPAPPVEENSPYGE